MSKMFTFTENGAFLASDPATAPEVTHIMMRTLLALYHHQINQTRGKEKKQLKEELYDLFNSEASAFLEALIPDRELRPDLTAEAIMEMENKLMEETTNEGREDN